MSNVMLSENESCTVSPLLLYGERKKKIPRGLDPCAVGVAPFCLSIMVYEASWFANLGHV